MKRLFVLFFFLSAFCTTSLYAQFLDLTIPSGELPSDISSWQENPKLMSITLTEPDGIEVTNGHIVFEVKEGSEHILASTKNRFAEQPTITGKFKKKNFTFADITTDSAADIDPSVKAMSGKLPGGFFGICFYLVDSSGHPLKEISQGCTNFFVRDIDAPTLLIPVNESIISSGSLVGFSWTPAHVLGQTVHYQLKLYRMLSTQTAGQAMSGSSAFYTSDDIFSTSYLYPSDAPPLSSFTNVKGFVWIVTQFDQNGKFLGKNSGRSVPSVFYQVSGGK
jgi:hypothetical protein